MAEFFDPFGHGKMDEKPKVSGKIVTISGEEHPGVDDDEPNFKELCSEIIEETEKEGKVTKAILILDGPDIGMTIRYIGEMNLADVVGTLQLAGFIVMHETSHDA